MKDVSNTLNICIQSKEKKVYNHLKINLYENWQLLIFAEKQLLHTLCRHRVDKLNQLNRYLLCDIEITFWFKTCRKNVNCEPCECTS